MLNEKKKQYISFPARPHQVLRQHRRRHQPHQVCPLRQGKKHTFLATRNSKPIENVTYLKYIPLSDFTTMGKLQAFLNPIQS